MTKKKTIKKKKLEIVFDPEKRKEFLTGFSKRKNERKKRAREELERNLKEERKRIRQEVKDGMKNLKKSFEPLRELTEEDKADDGDFKSQQENEYEDDDVKVKIVELTTTQLAKQRNFLGDNREDTTDDDNDKEEEKEDDSNDENDVNRIPGMDFDISNKRKRKHKTRNDTGSDTNDNEMENVAEIKSKKPRLMRGLESIDVKSKKDLDRFTSKKMRNKLRQSKAFRLNERFQKVANKKKAKRERNNTMKSLPKSQKKKMKTDPTSRYRKGRLMNKKQMRQKRKE